MNEGEPITKDGGSECRRLSVAQAVVLVVCIFGLGMLVTVAVPVDFEKLGLGTVWNVFRPMFAGVVVLSAFARWILDDEAKIKRYSFMGKITLGIVLVLAVVFWSMPAVKAHPSMDVTKRVPDGTEEYQVPVGAKQVFSHYETWGRRG
jgi:4-hydroxybenzoate polyprenyltransferase